MRERFNAADGRCAYMITGMDYALPPRLVRASHHFGTPQVRYLPDFLPAPRADELLAHTLAQVDWQSERLTLFGCERTAPRLVAWYGEHGASYRYSGAERTATRWPTFIARLAADVGDALAWRFNYALVNRYRSGADMLGWHADDEADLGEEPVIATVSLGAARVLRIRPRSGGTSVGGTLAHGSLLVMWGRSQRDYKHCVPRTRKPVGERVSYTFRCTTGRARGSPPARANARRRAR